MKPMMQYHLQLSLGCHPMRGHQDSQCKGQTALSVTPAEEGDKTEVGPRGLPAEGPFEKRWKKDQILTQKQMNMTDERSCKFQESQCRQTEALYLCVGY